MKNHQTDFLDRTMSRREFIQHMGSGLFLVFGGGVLSQFLTGFEKSQQRSGGKQYGSRMYGG